ncbi:MAG: protein-S-isoprenylcysteine O-methyltransferase [Planctomycetota bacterium]
MCSFVVYVAIRHVYQKRTAANEHEVRRIDTTERILLTIVLLGSLLLPVLYLFTPLLRFADYRLPAVLPWIGSGAQLVALWLFWRSHADLGVNWSISLEVRSGHQLVTHGVYRRVRHPMYSAMWLWSVAQAMLLQNWLAGCGALVTFAPLYWIRTPREERMMREAFGLDYDNYVARTGRLWPRLFRRQRDQ